MKYGIVDIGSNTIRLNIYKVNKEDKSYIRIANTKYTAGLVNYVKKDNLSNSGVKRLMYILTQISKISNFLEIENLYVFATASLRKLKNRDEILDLIYDELGIEVDLISGETEARLGIEGIRDEYNITDGLIIDIGGGSTEVSAVKDEVLEYTESFNLGSLSLQKKFVDDIMPNKKEVKKIEKEIRKELYVSDLPLDLGIDTMYGMGGTIRAVGNLTQDMYDRSDNDTVYYDDVVDLYKKLINRKGKAIRKVLKIIPSRTHTILPGLVILKELLEYTEIDTLKISQDGVREGYLKEVLKNGESERED